MSRSLEDAKGEALECPRCTSVSKFGRKIPLVYGRTQVVYGVGPSTADLMFIGEAPGEEEDKEGEPFVGRAGKILNNRLDEIGVPRKEVYIANVVMCRPTKVLDGCLSNRHPSIGEIRACADWLDEQVELVNPRLIVPLGVRAAKRALGRSVVMDDEHGELVSGEESVWMNPIITIIPTYHPTGARTSAQRRAFVADFKKIRDEYRRLRPS